VKRVWEHKKDFVQGFTKKYKCHKLVYYEVGEDYDGTLAREKQIKKWRRAKKTSLISGQNLKWQDCITILFNCEISRYARNG